MLTVDLEEMANLAPSGLLPKGRETRFRALLEDLAEYHAGVYPHNRLALAVWFGKALEGEEEHLLELFSALPTPPKGIVETRFSLLWKFGSEGPPFVRLRATSVEYFTELLRAHPNEATVYQDRYEVLYFEKNLLSPDVLSAFRIITEPPGLMKGWYVSDDEYEKAKNVQNLLSKYGHMRPVFALVKTEESPDFENCRGLLHVEITQRWLPLSPEGVQPYTYYNDLQNGHRVFFLFEGGALYEVLKFEVKTAPEYAARLLGKTPDDRYPEVYLRAVRPPAQSAA